jgi:hypothetical protein
VAGRTAGETDVEKRGKSQEGGTGVDGDGENGAKKTGRVHSADPEEGVQRGAG